MKKYKWALFITAYFIVAIICGDAIFSISNDMVGSSRVINYAGIVRGGTQRLVKLEISNNPNDELIIYINDILYDLQSEEEGTYTLKKLKDESFQQSLVELEGIWEELLIEIENTRLVGYESTNIIEVSERHFEYADHSVDMAEDFSDKLLRKYNLVKYVLIVSTLLLISTLLLLSKKLKALNKENIRIETFSHIDIPTGLPNKSKCQQKFEKYGTLCTKVNYGIIVFDLNNLKETNDVYGHNAGDLLIANFAKILQKNLEENAFAARFGGDEFMVIYDDTAKTQVELFIEKIRREVADFNFQTTKYNISFAVGYELSGFRPNMTMDTLFRKADKNMYLDKQKIKTGFNANSN